MLLATGSYQPAHLAPAAQTLPMCGHCLAPCHSPPPHPLRGGPPPSPCQLLHHLWPPCNICCGMVPSLACLVPATFFDVCRSYWQANNPFAFCVQGLQAAGFLPVHRHQCSRHCSSQDIRPEQQGAVVCVQWPAVCDLPLHHAGTDANHQEDPATGGPLLTFLCYGSQGLCLRSRQKLSPHLFPLLRNRDNLPATQYNGCSQTGWHDVGPEGRHGAKCWLLLRI